MPEEKKLLDRRNDGGPRAFRVREIQKGDAPYAGGARTVALSEGFSAFAAEDAAIAFADKIDPKAKRDSITVLVWDTDERHEWLFEAIPGRGHEARFRGLAVLRHEED